MHKGDEEKTSSTWTEGNFVTQKRLLLKNADATYQILADKINKS